MKFDYIAGHSKNIEFLKKMMDGGRIPHGLLFTGPEGIGKRVVAVALAAAMNCESPDKNGACGSCPSCKKLQTCNHPMVRFVGSPKKESEIEVNYGGGNNVNLKNIGGIKRTGEDGQNQKSTKQTVKINVDQIRELKREATLTPFEKSKKIFIIDDPAEASIGALNGILKILEEPPENTYFFLITSSADSLPATIISRCQRYSFKPLKNSEMQEFLNLRKDIAKEINNPDDLIDVAGGSPGKLIQYAGVDKIELENTDIKNYFDKIKKWLGDKEETLQKLNIMLQLEGKKFRKSPDEKKKKRLDIIEDTIEYLGKNANRELVVSNMFLKLGNLKR